MKKFLAIMMSVIMAFTLVAFPASAAVAEEEETTTTTQTDISITDVIDSLILTVELVQSTLIEVHNIVGTIMGVMEKDCPLCGVKHDVDFGVTEDGDAAEGEEGETGDAEIGDAETGADTFLPEIGEDMTEDEKEVAAILYEILILTGQLATKI